MRKSAIVLAGALAFDLGVMVVGGHAAESPGAKGPQAPATTVRKAGEKPVEYLKIKMDDVLVTGYALDRANTADACRLKSGKVIDVAGMPVCQLSTTPLTPGSR